jgi:hypothetical protein
MSFEIFYRQMRRQHDSRDIKKSIRLYNAIIIVAITACMLYIMRSDDNKRSVQFLALEYMIFNILNDIQYLCICIHRITRLEKDVKMCALSVQVGTALCIISQLLI